jgi:hypothetical protein
MRYLANHDLLGSRIFTDDADAGYVILACALEQRVFMDDRYDMYPMKVIDDYFTCVRRPPRMAPGARPIRCRRGRVDPARRCVPPRQVTRLGARPH